jgi:hypothetical protein
MIVGPVQAATTDQHVLINTFAGETWSTLPNYPDVSGATDFLRADSMTTVSITARIKA